jgi:hypothetical protein
MTPIGYPALRRLLEDGAQLVEVLPAEGILLGRLRGSTLDDAGPTIPAAEAMEAGPSSRAARQRRF